MRLPAILAAVAAALAGLVVALASIGGAAAQEATSEDPADGPNVVVLMTDDQTVRDMAPLRRTRRLIGGAGVTFTRSYVSYPICCPSRATFLTGQYAHNNDVHCLYHWCDGGYGRLNQREYLPVWLERAGYVTAHIGKFLNGYGREPNTPEIPRAWTEWHGLVDHSTYRMWGYTIYENGRRRTYGRVLRQRPGNYQTDVLRRKAVRFIGRRAPDDAPFFLSVAFLAPHHESGYTQRLTGELVRPAPRHRGRFAHAALRRPPNFNERDVSDKPWFIGRWNRLLTRRRERAITIRMRQRWESLLAVDEAVAAIVGELRRSGELDETYVIFTSDNGYMQGEHRIPLGKMLAYDPSTRVPLLIRGPQLPSGRRTRALVGNIDLAPTILDATPATSPHALDGRSILPFARNPRRRSLRPLLHETMGNGTRGGANTREGKARNEQPRVPAWRAVRTTRWLYVDYKGGQRELYDLKRDPAQLNSLAGDPRRRVRLRTLRRILGDLTRCVGDECQKGVGTAAR
jgi:N-acetylglucosamine-6-sulfatase